MSRDWAINAQYAERYNPADAVFDAARTIAADYAVTPLSANTAGLLRLLTQLAKPASALEVGTGTGTGTLAIMRGMPAGGVLTSIDVDADKQAVARELLGAARIRPHCVRMIHGRGEDVLARLAPGGYDLVFLDSEPLTYPRLVPLAIERFSADGLLIINQALLGDAVAKPANRAPRTQVMRTVLSDIEARTDIERLMIPIDAGLLVLRRLGQ